MWIPRPKELRELFVCSSLTLNSPIPRETFNARVRQAWRLLRFKVPELGVSTTCGEDGKLYMQYHTPKNQEVEEWIDRTHYCQSGEYKRDFEIVRGTLLAIKQGRNSNNALLLSRAIHEKGAELVKHSQIMICVDHQVADGIGARILSGKFLALLASSLGIGPVAAKTEIKWEDSCHNLSQPWIRLMNADQILSGPKYEETAVKNRDVLLDQMVITLHFPVQVSFFSKLRHALEKQSRPSTSGKPSTTNTTNALHHPVYSTDRRTSQRHKTSCQPELQHNTSRPRRYSRSPPTLDSCLSNDVLPNTLFSMLAQRPTISSIFWS